MAGPTPEELLGLARQMVDEPSPPTRGLWARAAAILGRQALEEAMCCVWRSKAPALEQANFTTQLICLCEFVADTHLAQQAAHVWACLSNACHYRGYGMPPTAQELTAWLNSVEVVLDLMEVLPDAESLGRMPAK